LIEFRLIPCRRIERRLVESLLYCLGLMGNIYEYNDLLGVQGKVE
jgi:hypothetical protein